MSLRPTINTGRPAKADVEIALNRGLFRGSIFGMVATGLAGLMDAAVLVDVVDPSWVAAWLAAMLGVLVMKLALTLGFRQLHDDADAHDDHIRLYGVVSAVLGLLFAFPILVIPPSGEGILIFHLAVVSALASGSIPLVSYRLQVFVLFIAPLGLLSVYGLIAVQGFPFGQALAMGGGVLIAAVIAGWRHHEHRRTTVRQGLRNDQLLRRLREESARAEDLAERLEQATGERDEARRSARIAEDRAARSSRTRLDVLANLGHEIRTPMTGIVGTLSMLEQTGPSEEQRSFLKVATSSARTLMALLDDILDLSKLDAGRLELRNEPYDLRAVLSEVVELFRSRARERGISLTLEAAATLPGNLLGDPLRVRQVLTNVVSNAVKFTERGSVSVHARRVEEYDRIEITVRDTGIGMSPDQVSRLFQPYAQADSGIASRFGGTGLGLAISSRLARRMGGDIQADSSLGKGTEVRLQLPLVPRYEDVSQGASDPRRPDAHYHGRLLLVDADHGGRMLSQIMLERLGLEVIPVTNATDAMSVLGSHEVDLLLVDAASSTSELARLARRPTADDSGTVPVLAMTRIEDAGRDCIRAGADGCIEKPLDPRQLMSMLDRWLPFGAGRGA